MRVSEPLRRVMSILCSNFPDENAVILLLGLQSCDLALWVGWDFFLAN